MSTENKCNHVFKAGENAGKKCRAPCVESKCYKHKNMDKKKQYMESYKRKEFINTHYKLLETARSISDISNTVSEYALKVEEMLDNASKKGKYYKERDFDDIIWILDKFEEANKLIKERTDFLRKRVSLGKKLLSEEE